MRALKAVPALLLKAAEAERVASVQEQVEVEAERVEKTSVDDSLNFVEQNEEIGQK